MPDMTSTTHSNKRLIARPRFVISIILAEFITLAITLGPLLGTPWWKGFRAYFSHDQLSYAAIATNVSQGHFAVVEPLTESGISHYPSLWYYVIGSISWLTHLPVWIVWTVFGVAAGSKLWRVVAGLRRSLNGTGTAASTEPFRQSLERIWAKGEDA